MGILRRQTGIHARRAPMPGMLVRRGPRSREESTLAPTLAELFEQNLAAAGGRVRRATVQGVSAVVRDAVGPEALVVVSPELEGLASLLREAGIQAHVATRSHLATSTPEEPGEARSLPAGADAGAFETLLRRADCGVLLGIAGVASSGTVLVGPGGGNGGLLASLPPRTILLLEESRLVAGLAEALTVAFERFSEDGGELMLITGPSRTADIEMLSVVGVHGPLGVEVVLVDAPLADALSTDPSGAGASLTDPPALEPRHPPTAES